MAIAKETTQAELAAQLREALAAEDVIQPNGLPKYASDALYASMLTEALSAPIVSGIYRSPEEQARDMEEQKRYVASAREKRQGHAPAEDKPDDQPITVDNTWPW